MKRGVLFTVIFELLFAGYLLAQNTITSGNWSDPSVWSTGVVPASNSTVNVNNPLTLDQSLSLSGGAFNYTFNSNTTDNPGGFAYSLSLNDNNGVFTVSTGVTVTFEGTGTFNAGTVDVYGTLILGASLINNSSHMNIYVHTGGTLIINGDLTDKNNSGTFSIDGALQVNGNFSVQTGSVTVGGSGTINTTGSLTSNGGSTVLGYTNDCTTGPCSGTTLSCSFSNTISPADEVLCSGSTPSTITATTSGSSPTYLWESSTTSQSSGFSSASGTNTNSTYSAPSGLSQTTWYRVAVTSGGCTSRSAAEQVTVLTGGGWKGVTSDWNTASNWCTNSVPTSVTDVVISPFPAGSGLNMPTINSAINATAHTLNINSGATLTVSSGGTLSIYGDLINNGILTDNSNTSNGVSLLGTATQTISGSSLSTFNNLTINNTSGSVPAINVSTNNVIVNNNLVMTAGSINMNGYNLTLGTSDFAPGALTYSSGTIYNGNFTRWFPTSSITVGSVAGLFPVGSSTDYRPMYLGDGGIATSGGTIKISHTAIVNSTSVSPTFTDNGGTVALRSNSYWTVYTGSGIGSGTFNLLTEGTGFGTVGAVTDLRITKVNSIAPGTDGAHAGTTSNPQVNRNGVTTANLPNNYYWGSINASQTPLPVNVLYFTGEYKSNEVYLTWATTMEKNFDYFTIERSGQDLKFKPLNKINSADSTSSKLKVYDYVDEFPLPGISYYRLKSTDFDGSSAYHGIVAINSAQEDNKIILYPNPTNGSGVTVNYSGNGESTFMILTFMGNQVDQGVIGPGKNDIVFHKSLAPGIYLLYINDNPALKPVRFVVR